MAYGEVRISGDDVFEALTYCTATTKYERVLNDEGERLAELIAQRVIAIIQKKLAAVIEEVL